MHENSFPIELPVKFASQSSNKESASIGLSISRDHADVLQVEEVFVGKRITAELELGDKGRTKPLPGMENDSRKRLSSVFDVKRYGSQAKEFTTRLVGAVSLAAKLSQFAGRTGVLTITGIDSLPEKEKKPKSGKALPPAEKVAPSREGRDPADDTPLEALTGLGGEKKLTEKQIEKLTAANGGMRTIGELEAWMRKDDLWHRKISGFGKIAIDTLGDAIVEWRKVNPVPVPHDEPEAAEDATEIDDDATVLSESSSDVPENPEDLPIHDLANYGVPVPQCRIVAEHVGGGTMKHLFDWLDTDGTKLEEIPKLAPTAILRLKEAIAAWEEKHPAPPSM